MGASDRAVAPSDFVIYVGRPEGLGGPSAPCLIWRKLAGGTASERESRTGIAGRACLKSRTTPHFSQFVRRIRAYGSP